jgi:hypothetical protein
MNPLVKYAKIVTSFQNLYRQRDPNSRYTVAVASAMSGLLIINIWTFILLASFVDHGWFASRRRITPVEFAGLFVGLFVVQMILIDFVFTKVDGDKRFASRVVPASPRISMWYGGISIALLVVSTILKLGTAF